MTRMLDLIRKRLGKDWLELLRGVGASYVMQGFGMATMFALQLYLTRSLSLEDFGSFVNARALTILFAAVAGLGFATATFRFLPVLIRDEDWSRAKGWLNFTLGSTLIAAIIASVIMLSALYFFSAYFEQPEKRFWVLVFCAGSIPLFALNNLHCDQERAFGRIVWPIFMNLVATPGIFLILLIAGWVYGFQSSAVQVAATYFASQLFILLAHRLYFQRLIGNRLSGVKPSYEPALWILTALPLIILGGHQYLLGQIDIILFNLHGQLIAGGIYENTQKIANIAWLPITAVSTIAVARYAVLRDPNDPEPLATYTSSVLTTIMAATLPVCVFFVLFRDPILGLFGAAYTQGGDMLIIRLVCVLISAAAAPAGHLLAVTGHEKEVFFVFVLSFVTEILFGYVFIAMYGIEGMALARLATLIILQILLCYLVRRHLGFWPVVFIAKRWIISPRSNAKTRN